MVREFLGTFLDLRNTFFSITRRGGVELLHVFNDVALADGTTIDAVPTNMAFGPDGAIYISTLTGVPFPEGAATVWRWDGVSMTPYAEGLTAAIDLDFGPDGSLYVSTEQLRQTQPAFVVDPRRNGIQNHPPDAAARSGGIHPDRPRRRVVRSLALGEESRC